MRRLWLLFAQTATLVMAALLALQVFRPDLLSRYIRPALPVSPSMGIERSGARPVSSEAVKSYAKAAKQAVPAVVFVQSSKAAPRYNPFYNDPLLERFFGNGQGADTGARRLGLGSGVIVSADGYVLTNNHVIEGADAVEVTLNDGQKFPAQVIGKDPETDLAVMRLLGAKDLPVMHFAHQDALQVGDVVLAIGNPFGVGQTVTMGIVSAQGRNHLGINAFENFIQTDAAINPGNSGGALVNTEGELVGINTAIYSNSGGSLGIGFAIPAALARTVLEQITAYGEVTRGWAGVEIQELSTELANSFGLEGTQGALISGVIRGGPADKAGIEPGDILLAVSGSNVADSRAMLDAIAALPPDSKATFKIYRRGKTFDLELKIGKRPAPGARRH